MKSDQPVVIYSSTLTLADAVTLAVSESRQYELTHNEYPRVEYVEAHPWDYGVNGSIISFFIFFQEDSFRVNREELKASLRATASSIYSDDPPDGLTEAQLNQYIEETGSIRLGV